MLTTAKVETITITAIVIRSCIVLKPCALLKGVLFIICSRRLRHLACPSVMDGRSYLAMTMPLFKRLFY